MTQQQALLLIRVSPGKELAIKTMLEQRQDTEVIGLLYGDFDLACIILGENIEDIEKKVEFEIRACCDDILSVAVYQIITRLTRGK